MFEASDTMATLGIWDHDLILVDIEAYAVLKPETYT